MQLTGVKFLLPIVICSRNREPSSKIHYLVKNPGNCVI